MVSLDDVKSTNSKLAIPKLVAVFAGATAGIGSFTLLHFAEHAIRPKIYFLGRSQEQADLLTKQLKEKNAEGEYIFVKADLSSMKNVDQACEKIKQQEKSINILLMSQGALKLGTTEEGLPYVTAVGIMGRLRMVQNLMPLLRKGQSLRRVVSVMAGGKEGKLYLDDIPARRVNPAHGREHAATTMTLGLEGLARQAPEVSFVHSFPGPVLTNLIRKESGLMLRPLKYLFQWRYRNSWISPEETGERHTFLCVSAQFPPKDGGDALGVPLEGQLEVAKGSDGSQGSGVYIVDERSEVCSNSFNGLAKYRDEGAVDKVWQGLDAEFKRIIG
ncbi:unnamed protein product [Clonostachys chloroleuca]|uniref:Uncharacterized protein n=1 Tax=Clonostachys chloroleuca TaxID=1926264 RepID=A0AA35Q4W7_9HYPO|nr:unnamed protein product [Clonostachys chloroleuca]